MFRRKGIYCLVESVQKRRIYGSVDYVQERWNILFRRICSGENKQNLLRREVIYCLIKSVQEREMLMLS